MWAMSSVCTNRCEQPLYTNYNSHGITVKNENKQLSVKQHARFVADIPHMCIMHRQYYTDPLFFEDLLCST